MKRLSFFALFLILLIGVSLTSCNFNGSNDVPISVNEDSSLKELKKKYESLVNEKSVLQDRLLNLTSSYSSLQTEITKLKADIKRIDEEIENSYSIFSYLENSVLESAVLVSHSSFSESNFWFFDFKDYIGGGIGSGFIFRQIGNYYYILTNNHVIYPKEGSTLEEIYVNDYYYNEYSATLLANDASYDMAILRIERKANDLPVMKFASDNPVRNDLVFAIGNPHGQINSVGIGNVLGYSKVNLSKPVASSNVKYDVINHDAYMLSGNSGGMLVNLAYEVVGINLDENGQAIATLQYIHNKKLVEVDKIRKHLSWGERNAFSLVLFMFYAISENAKLIVLDDPISSFDTNKKYAIIHRMFSKQSGILPRSFYKKTVLMLTHDFEPIIDFGVVGKLPEDALNSKFIKNNQGILTEKVIDYKQDIKPVVQALAAYIKDDALGIVHRIAFLRKYYEHNGIENHKEAYDVLSSLIHGREQCKYVNNSEMPQAEIQKGCTEIKKWIQSFDYAELYKNVYNEEKLAELYFAETNDYLKIQLFRALFEVNPSKEIKEEDVLVKFINESYHIENDYAYYLDMVKFETVPEYIVKAIDDYMERTYSKA